ncbi:hypothetical protein BN13_1130018 [Nostocoides jenkinsii Ben 74]|uniref:Uncharacterized protein n=1 Tax=Nostocoides jenkinsii Ben 74 TaxID=1193518 RepID=A0A077M793_9MICO|nr:hypothetical protein BN13_1130018 [Tetrasphaera jenkinsii Ben 74]
MTTVPSSRAIPDPSVTAASAPRPAVVLRRSAILTSFSLVPGLYAAPPTTPALASLRRPPARSHRTLAGTVVGALS